ncbi:MAG TPA: hypothetical protein DCQ25_03365 [Elusimicrobia bacterium]|nr:hypothetical protein [Elusimicrobiota bacterium]
MARHGQEPRVIALAVVGAVVAMHMAVFVHAVPVRLVTGLVRDLAHLPPAVILQQPHEPEVGEGPAGAQREREHIAAGAVERRAHFRRRRERGAVGGPGPGSGGPAQQGGGWQAVAPAAHQNSFLDSSQRPAR